MLITPVSHAREIPHATWTVGSTENLFGFISMENIAFALGYLLNKKNEIWGHDFRSIISARDRILMTYDRQGWDERGKPYLFKIFQVLSQQQVSK